ncbi:MAG: purine-nucleoside phosphorylase [Candidatus Izemoplasmatales bacterium]|nr:purine-nucleoside phosphorylase [Candidatus Izemoplasmatales bacterium]MDY0138821.1 purine-nucleoside phosphorylase [Candidatus Izemoplasmatales bacterium]
MSTPHINAEKHEIAKVVLMPGDPLRAKYIADTFLTDVKQFNSVRNMFGYTGLYNGRRISVMGSGMGMPSIGIYSYELFKFYDVDTIIRIGSCGAYTKTLKLYDTILVTEAFSESSFAFAQGKCEEDTLPASKTVNEKLEAISKELDIPVVKGKIHSSDVFYRQFPEEILKLAQEKELLGVEMESFALFHNANVTNKNAACLLTVSDSLVTSESTTPEERQTAFTNMMKIALEMAE